MNFITIIILSAILFDFILHTVSDMLNLSRISNELPEEFKGYYDEESYSKSQDYLRVNTRFGFITSTVNLILLLAFWFAKGFPILDQWARSMNHGPIVTGLIYVGVLILAKSIINLPFRMYSTFAIEERFGFNKTTWKTYSPGTCCCTCS